MSTRVGPAVLAAALLAALAMVVAGCQPSASPTATGSSVAPSLAPSTAPWSDPFSPDPSAAAAADLRAHTALTPGRYTRGDFEPRITFEVGSGWSTIETGPGLLVLKHDQDGAGSIRFLRPIAVYGATSRPVPVGDAATTAAVLREHDILATVGESPSRMSGLDGVVVELEHPGSTDAVAPVFDVLDFPDGPLALRPGRALWVALFDTPDGVLAIVVEGDRDTWEAALATAEPVLESVTIGR